MATDNPALRHILDRARELRGTVDGWPTLIGEIEAVCAPPVQAPGEAEITARVDAQKARFLAIGALIDNGDLGDAILEAQACVPALDEFVALMRRAAAPAASKALREAAQAFLDHTSSASIWIDAMREALAVDAAKETPQ